VDCVEAWFVGALLPSYRQAFVNLPMRWSDKTIERRGSESVSTIMMKRKSTFEVASRQAVN